MGEAEPGQVLVSRTIRDVVAGTGPEIDMPGSRLLGGMSGEWELFAAQSRRRHGFGARSIPAVRCHPPSFLAAAPAQDSLVVRAVRR